MTPVTTQEYTVKVAHNRSEFVSAIAWCRENCQTGQWHHATQSKTDSTRDHIVSVFSFYDKDSMVLFSLTHG